MRAGACEELRSALAAHGGVVAVLGTGRHGLVVGGPQWCDAETIPGAVQHQRERGTRSDRCAELPSNRGQIEYGHHVAAESERWVPMTQVTLSIPDEILLALKATPDDLASRIRFAASVKMYEMGQLSSGAASQLAGVPKPYFLSRLADYGVTTFDFSEEELTHDIKSA